MVGETCEFMKPDLGVCGAAANPCMYCHKAFCQDCYLAHKKEHHPEAGPAVESTAEPSKPSAFDPLFVDPDKVPQQSAPADLPQEPPSEPEEPISEEEVGEMFSSEIDKVVQALNRLALRGLNQAAVIALIHDAEPKIPKSTIGTVLRTLRQLPDLYGRKRPGRKA